MTNEELLLKYERGQKALQNLSWETVTKVRNANGCLYPLDWEKVKENWKKDPWEKPLTVGSKEEFEEKLKELCDSLYDWGLYEPCPICKCGIKIPVFAFTQWTAFCGCSNYPKCNFSLDREGKPIDT